MTPSSFWVYVVMQEEALCACSEALPHFPMSGVRMCVACDLAAHRNLDQTLSREEGCSRDFSVFSLLIEAIGGDVGRWITTAFCWGLDWFWQAGTDVFCRLYLMLMLGHKEQPTTLPFRCLSTILFQHETCSNPPWDLAVSLSNGKNGFAYVLYP